MIQIYTNNIPLKEKITQISVLDNGNFEILNGLIGLKREIFFKLAGNPWIGDKHLFFIALIISPYSSFFECASICLYVGRKD
jgi:hypothetical protein